MPSNMNLPYSNGRPLGPTPRNGYSTGSGGRSSPISGMPSSPSLSNLKNLSSSILTPPDGYTSDAVMEKHRLSTGRSHSTFAGWFTPWPVPLPFTQRKLLVPVPNALHPSPQGIIAPHYRANHPRHSPLGGGHRRERSLRRVILCGLALLVVVLLAFSRIRSAIRQSARNIPLPFQDPSTLVLSEEEIRRVWEWEISSGHYPSSRRLPTVVHLNRVGNPGLPRKGGDDSDQRAASPRILDQGQARAPPAFLGDIVPVGQHRAYLNLTAPSVYTPSFGSRPPQPYPPRPVPNTILDMDAVMDYCDFSTNQYVRDCLEILRIGGGLDSEKRVRRGDTSRWRHVYLERDHDDGRNAAATNAKGYNPGALSESTVDIAEPYRPQDVMAQINSEEYPSLLHEVKRQSLATAGTRRAAKGQHPTHLTADSTCDPDYPRLYHIFWAGPFTDKPYLALMSFLFTQNLGLHLPLAGQGDAAGQRAREEFLSGVCRPQMWVWINPGPAAAVPNPSARAEMLDDLARNPWSAPFLHPRFREVVKFKLWNTTEQLDGVPELAEHWRDLPLFNSGGVKYGGTPAAGTSDGQKAKGKGQDTDKKLVATKEPVKIGVTVGEAEAKRADPDGDGKGEHPDVVEEELGRFGNHTRGEAAVAEDAIATQGQEVVVTKADGSVETQRGEPAPVSPPSGADGDATAGAAPKKSEDELFERIGSTSSKGYDRLSVVLSDMARFVLCHRFGGTYLDADTILLRDWEELWGWKGQFAYRWSRLEKYNTAVLRLHRHSAMGSFLFKTALANGLDFHPMTISRYTKDAYLEGLLLRLPDALFDSAWLNTEYYQRDRPPFPYFKRFEDFFDPPKENDAGPAAVGFDGFFRGAYSYHFHNFWWIPFDPSRNWPDLGPRFADGERKARAKALAAKIAAKAPSATPPASGGSAAASAGATGRGGQVSPNAQLTGPTGAAAGGRRPKTMREIEAELVETLKLDADDVVDDERDLGWATVLKRTFEAYLRNERPNMYGEWLDW